MPQNRNRACVPIDRQLGIASYHCFTLNNPALLSAYSLKIVFKLNKLTNFGVPGGQINDQLRRYD
ncbi:hypothetical protein Nit79A3_0309 [Nitrosomonas sp. Is79A3]|uniref:hypothetical protein n=1 Tax=Nitrosomonas sp. (strain Is79A3) TaxID=261292 RepID=UPI000215D27E